MFGRISSRSGVGSGNGPNWAMPLTPIPLEGTCGCMVGIGAGRPATPPPARKPPEGEGWHGETEALGGLGAGEEMRKSPKLDDSTPPPEGRLAIPPKAPEPSDSGAMGAIDRDTAGRLPVDSSCCSSSRAALAAAAVVSKATSSLMRRSSSWPPPQVRARPLSVPTGASGSACCSMELLAFPALPPRKPPRFPAVLLRAGTQCCGRICGTSSRRMSPVPSPPSPRISTMMRRISMLRLFWLFIGRSKGPLGREKSCSGGSTYPDPSLLLSDE
mmetsp:Transcript_11973/g.30643  ORF Transcript_11973/g.30643 Transcript_11973/m.30643 type:complete len:272 (+) Transcript_11973:102-917(+)